MRFFVAGGKGVEPIHTDSESAVLPLDEPPLQKYFTIRQKFRLGSFVLISISQHLL